LWLARDDGSALLRIRAAWSTGIGALDQSCCTAGIAAPHSGQRSSLARGSGLLPSVRRSFALQLFDLSLHVGEGLGLQTRVCYLLPNECLELLKTASFAASVCSEWGKGLAGVPQERARGRMSYWSSFPAW